MLLTETRQGLIEAAKASLRKAFPPRVRTMRQFAESEIIIPGGPHKGQFSCHTQPWTGLWFDQVDSGVWRRHIATGPTQSGKTACCYVIPAMYHLFEIGEDVVCGVPKMEMARDKWEKDFLPAINASRYRDLLPLRGKGSRGGSFESIQFTSGKTLKFMTGGGDDQSRAGFTSRVLVVTEVDGLDTSSEKSRETDPISQMEGRLLAYGHDVRVYLECTVSIPSGRIRREYESGSASRIAMPCPHCGGWVTPEREDFRGWEAAENEIAAEACGQFYCPDCGTGWSPSQRVTANRNAKLVHRGQEIDPEGNIVGPMPETRTLGFRWTGANNLFHDERLLGSIEWKAARDQDRESAEKKMQQQFWCIPYRGADSELGITEDLIASRLTGLPRGVLPDDTESLVVQIDIHNRWHYWTALATSPGNVRSIVDYGLFLTPNPDINGPELAIRLGLENLAEELDGRKWLTVNNREHPIDLHFVDAGYQQDIGLAFVTEMGAKWRLHKGQGRGDGGHYNHPKELTPDEHPGEHWHLSKQPLAEEIGQRWWLVLSETSYWMRLVHSGFSTEPFLPNSDNRRPDSIAIFGSDPGQHLAPQDRTVSRSKFATQLMAWKWGEITTPKKGTTLGWVPQWKEDHWFDTTYGCLVAASFMDAVRLAEKAAKDREDAEREAERNRQGGRKFVRSMEKRRQ